MIKKIISKYLPLIVLVLSVPAVRYLFVHGFFGVSDDLHIAWLFEMDRAIKMFQIPPRFVPDLSYGFGYPLFNFVYPLPFYLGEIIHLLGFSLVNSVKIIFGLSIPFSLYFMYKFLKEFLSEELSLAGAVLYVYAPYRAVELFVRGTFGEIVSFVFLPLIALAFMRLTGKKKPTLKWVGLAAIAIAFLVLSHNIMAYMFMPFVLLLLVARIIWVAGDKKAAVKYSLAGLILGLVISAYFWVPAIAESKLVHYDTVFNFYDHFPTLKQFITPYFGYGASVPGPYDTMSFYMGMTGLIVVSLGMILFAVRFKKYTVEERVAVVWATVVFLTSIFMMNYRSAFLWRNLPLLPYFQFPWRFLAMIVFASPIFLISFSKFKVGKAISLVVIVLAVVLNFNYFKTSEYLGREDAYYLNRYIPFPEASADYRQTSEEYLRLPKDTQKRPSSTFPRVYSDTRAITQIKEINALNTAVTTSYPEGFNLNVSKYNFPGWAAKIDGKRVAVGTGSPYGQITVWVPKGEHQVAIYYKESPFRLVFDLFSLGALVIATILILKKRK